jgi:hypothetical protein
MKIKTNVRAGALPTVKAGSTCGNRHSGAF